MITKLEEVKPIIGVEVYSFSKNPFHMIYSVAVPIIVAINKIDKPEADIVSIKCNIVSI